MIIQQITRWWAEVGQVPKLWSWVHFKVKIAMKSLFQPKIEWDKTNLFALGPAQRDRKGPVQINHSKYLNTLCNVSWHLYNLRWPVTMWHANELTQVRGWKLTKVIEMLARKRMKKVRYNKRSEGAIIYVLAVNFSFYLCFLLVNQLWQEASHKMCPVRLRAWSLSTAWPSSLTSWW